VNCAIGLPDFQTSPGIVLVDPVPFGAEAAGYFCAEGIGRSDEEVRPRCNTLRMSKMWPMR
jgi:hypothetical protein